MLVKKANFETSPERGIQKELEYLYARRSAIDSLIQSLEMYDRFREKGPGESKRKTA